jgi:hypothetical protein
VLFCDLCGSKFTTHNYSCKTDENGSKTSKASYRCNSKKYVSKDTSCSAGDIMHEKVEQAFIEYIENINVYAEIKDLDLSESKNERNELNECISDYEFKLTACSKKKKQVLEQYINEEITFAEYREMLKALDEKYEVIEKELLKKK